MKESGILHEAQVVASAAHEHLFQARHEVYIPISVAEMFLEGLGSSIPPVTKGKAQFEHTVHGELIEDFYRASYSVSRRIGPNGEVYVPFSTSRDLLDVAGMKVLGDRRLNEYFDQLDEKMERKGPNGTMLPPLVPAKQRFIEGYHKIDEPFSNTTNLKNEMILNQMNIITQG